MFRKTYLEIDCAAVHENIRTLKSKSGKELIGVIKANAYGSGDREAVRLLEEEGVSFLAVSSLEEALALRGHGYKRELLILGPVDEDYLDIVRENDCTIVTVSENSFESFEDLKGLKVHLKLDTGMRRIGIRPENAQETLNTLLNKHANVNGIMTHFAKSDDVSQNFTTQQYRLFEETVKELNYSFRYIHTSNTDATVDFNDSISTHVRCGIGLWGYDSFNELKSSLSLYTEVTDVKKVDKGDAVSYGGHYISDGEGYILTLPIGYADGIRRCYTGREVYIEGEKAPIVGNICMDQMMIHTHNYYPLKTKVELFGPHIPLKEMAKALHTIPYEVLTSVSDRVARVYVGEDIPERIPRFKK